jgi:hypothetical protein
MKEKRDTYEVFVGKLRKASHFEDIGIDGKIILNGS